ncbi:MAG: purine-nucleoside phosphorylase [Desulfobulbus sp.]|nr:MAG: purine-nucleoside phosphorylase [Desulfobulbus sp.]
MAQESTYKKRVEEAVGFLRQRISARPDIVLQLGTGLGAFAEAVEEQVLIPYADIPHFPQSTVTSHAGNLVFGTLCGRKVALLQGRLHFYEGYGAREVAFPVRVLSRLGCRTAVITNAAGGLNPDFSPGTIMVFSDHIYLLPDNPLRGPNVDDWGPRFPDLSQPYDRRLQEIAFTAAAELGFSEVVGGTYVCIPGPSLETPAETRYLRMIGADAVGMSSLPEVLVAIHGGMQVLGISVVANVNDPDNFTPILLDDIVAAAGRARPRLQQLLSLILPQL